MTTNLREPLVPGEMFLKYRVDSLLGRGGHAFVYAAEDTYLERSVAIKVIPPPVEKRSDLYSRGRREAQILSQLEHPNVVKVYDAGVTSEGVAYIVMELLPGHTLRAALRNFGAFSILEALHVGIQIAEAVQAAHAHPKQAIHRDLKPENVFVVPGNTIKVLDFGISRLLDGNPTITQPNIARGTPQYMSPEQMEGRVTTVQSDIFALGSVLYELLVTVAPAVIGLQEVSNAAIAYSVVHRVPPHLYEVSSDIPRYVDRVIRCMLAKTPRERPASMKQVAEDLRALQQRFTAESPTLCSALRELWQGTSGNGAGDAVDAQEFSKGHGVHSATTVVGNVVLTNQVTAALPNLGDNVPLTTQPLEPLAPAAAATLPEPVPNFVTIAQPVSTPHRDSAVLSESKELVARAERLIARRMAEQRLRPVSASGPTQRSALRSVARSYSVKFLVLATLFGSGVGYGALLMVRHSGAATASNVVRPAPIAAEQPTPVASIELRPSSSAVLPNGAVTPSNGRGTMPQPDTLASTTTPREAAPVAPSNRATQAIAQVTKKKTVTPNASAAPSASVHRLWLPLDSEDDEVSILRGFAKRRSVTKPAASATPASKLNKKKDQLLFGADDVN